LQVDFATFGDEIKAFLGLDEVHAAKTIAKALQLLIVVLLTLWIARWVREKFRRRATGGRLSAEVATLLSQAATVATYGLGTTVALAVLGATWTAIAAIVGATTLGISLALQDVGRGFVNGIYILIERPFRIGDRVRVGSAEGRVEEVGVRLTVLRTPAGDRIIVPNTVVFSSIIESSANGEQDRQHYAVSGIELPISDIENAVRRSLAGMPHLSARSPIVALMASSPDGTNIQVTVEHDLGNKVDDQVITRLRSLFPGATVATVSAVLAS